MSELLAVAGLTLSHKAGSPISSGTFTVTSTPDAKTKCQNKGVFVNPLTFTFAGGNAPGFLDGSVAGGGSIPATAVKTKIQGVAVIREGDSATMACVGTIEPPPSPPAPPTGPVSGDVEVSDAGQSKTKGE